jgi:hypothetical protein
MKTLKRLISARLTHWLQFCVAIAPSLCRALQVFRKRLAKRSACNGAVDCLVVQTIKCASGETRRISNLVARHMDTVSQENRTASLSKAKL